ncbi:MAG: hypothetical protein KC619_04725 [Myxococcales bacterium]|nr:hypothetical protein [Myxococcales bacterium]
MRADLRVVLMLAASVILLGSCSSSVELYVDVVTDLRPAVDFTHVRVILGALEVQHEASAAESYVDGVRVAELGPLVPADYAFRVELRRGDAIVLARSYRLVIEGPRVETVLLTSRCLGVSCPRTGDLPEATVCRSGLCVDPRCLERPGTCSPQCESDGECVSEVECSVGRCIEGSCFFAPDDGLCPSDERCDPVEGCFGGALLGDPCRSPDDCGVSLICCGGRCESPGCDDGNACTDDVCGAAGCEHAPSTGSCDDGVFCNGADTCAGGTCSVHSGDPCGGASVCDEPAAACVGCVVDADCPPDAEARSGICAGFVDVCDEGGTEAWTVTSYRCESRACVSSAREEIRPCARITGGMDCGGLNETCNGGVCRCGTGPACGAGQTCYRDGRCGATPTFWNIGIPTPTCSNAGLAPTTSSIAGYLVRGRPGARVHKYNRHVSCGGGWIEAPETADTPIFLDAAGEYLLEIIPGSPIPCSLSTLGHWENYVEVDGIRVPDVGVLSGTFYHSECAGVRTCAEALTYCPP